MKYQEDLIDLGGVTAETKGPIGPINDFRNGMLATGLNQD